MQVVGFFQYILASVMKKKIQALATFFLPYTQQNHYVVLFNWCIILKLGMHVTCEEFHILSKVKAIRSKSQRSWLPRGHCVTRTHLVFYIILLYCLVKLNQHFTTKCSHFFILTWEADNSEVEKKSQFSILMEQNGPSLAWRHN